MAKTSLSVPFGVLYYYRDCLSEALEILYPEYVWLPWHFQTSPRSLWKRDNRVIEFVHWVGKTLGITQLDEWYHVPLSNIKQLGGKNLLAIRGGLYNILKIAYPQFPWNKERFQDKHSWGKAQWTTFRLLNKIQPLRDLLDRNINNNNIDNSTTPTMIELNYNHPNLFYSNTKQPVELDIYIPSLSLAFEYQGEQHYHRNTLFGDPQLIRSRDEEKKQLCKEANITLIEIPFWWDYNIQDLEATIHHHRPDIIKQPPSAGKVLSLEIPPISSRTITGKKPKKKLAEQRG